MKKILILGAGGAAGWNFIESLRISPEKFHTIATDNNKYHLELSNADVKYQVPNVNDKNYLNKINKIIDAEKIDFVYAQSDPEVKFISENREKIKTKTYLPSISTVRLCQDKAKLTKLLSEKKINTGMYLNFKTISEFDKGAKVLFNSHRKLWLRARKGAGSKASLPVTNIKQAINWISYWEEMGKLNLKDFMLTEFLPGKEYAFQSLWKDGNLITSQARERIEYIFPYLSPSGQSSSPAVARTVNNKVVNETAINAILAADRNANGIFCVDLKENKNGVPCVTEINSGRFFTTSLFFSSAGINMPYYYVKLGLGEKIPALPKENALAADIFWVRMIDMGYKLIKGEKWKSKII
jgi:hypothetical protein